MNEHELAMQNTIAIMAAQIYAPRRAKADATDDLLFIGGQWRPEEWLMRESLNDALRLFGMASKRMSEISAEANRNVPPLGFVE